MKSFSLITLILSLLAGRSYSQTLISGEITDAVGVGLPGANVYLKGTYDGASSDENGSFQFETDELGTQVLVVSMVGYHEFVKEITCEEKGIHLNVVLKESINELTAVTITAGAIEASDEAKSFIMKPLDIVTTSGAAGNLFGALTKLPGTATVGNDGRLFVRGGDASETNIYIDGLEVANAYGSTAPNVPTRSRFDANLFKGSFFSTGGYSAEYGQALSSALVLNSVDMPLRNQADISLMSVGGTYSQTLIGKQNSISFNGSFMDLKPYQSIISQNYDWQRAPHSWSAELLGRQKYGESGMLKVFAHTESAQFTLNQPVVGEDYKQSIEMNNKYHFGSASFKQSLDENWFVYGGASFSLNTDDVKIDNIPYETKAILAHGKMAAVKDFSDQFSVKNGIEYYYDHFTQQNVNLSLEREYNNDFVDHFIEADYYLSSKFVLRGGLRTSYSSYLNEIWATPRASLAYKSGDKSQFSLAYGAFRQMPKPERIVQADRLENSKAQHLIFNYLLEAEGRTFRIESFYKKYSQLVKFDTLVNQTYYHLNNSGEGYSRGFDLFYRDNKSITGTDFWVTYSFVDSKRKFDQFTTQVTPGYAPRHNVSVVMKHFIKQFKSQIGFSYSWNDGYTYNDKNQSVEMGRKTKDYHNLSLSWSYLPRPNIIIHAECSNVLASENVFGYEFSTKPDESGKYARQPIIQSADRFLFLGIFITLSKDKSANMMNNL
ncbi:TonB-dependent receptor [Fulvivirga sediminis]|uniref:TonB-dependent receptor n=1 Tax=Fulvivirga sediminis TaxID=2803949 RepID=A0A937JYC7_9BACT|nr:TonB-dependent receptor [Fulvivirga sediminis]MBL3656303.1 TonB-dependent receptor [Fulvivirga sediminis]